MSSVNKITLSVSISNGFNTFWPSCGFIRLLPFFQSGKVLGPYLQISLGRIFCYHVSQIALYCESHISAKTNNKEPTLNTHITFKIDYYEMLNRGQIIWNHRPDCIKHISTSVATECMHQIISWNYWCLLGHAMAQMVMHCFLEPLVQSQVTSCGIHGGWSSTVAGSSPSLFGFILLTINQTFLHTFVTAWKVCVIALTSQSIIFWLKFHASSLTQHLVCYRVSKFH